VDQTRSTFNYDNPVELKSIFFVFLGGEMWPVAFEEVNWVAVICYV
jgi:hypothetical protein